MRVTCKFCKFEEGGTCTKKVQNGHPSKVKLTKRRTCNVFEEDPMRVFTQFRKNEAHRANIRRQTMRRAKLTSAISDLRKEGLGKVIDTGITNID